MTQIGKIGITRQCGVCGRTLLLGEQVEEFTNGARSVSVCALCLSEAAARGWLLVGAPAPPPVEEDVPDEGERHGWLRRRRAPTAVEEPEPPSGRSLPVPAARALERVVDAFNASAYRRTLASIAKSLGVPRASVVVLSGNRPDAIVTVAWEISWYQYRVEAEHGGHVRLEDRGDDPGVIDQRWRDWNAQVAVDGQLTLV
ncbi:MAG TPA: hypothetical protein VFD90_03150 [Gaiellales bacterium]|nr:hypothetical protein [Gaiellales bacterium]